MLNCLRQNLMVCMCNHGSSYNVTVFRDVVSGNYYRVANLYRFSVGVVAVNFVSVWSFGSHDAYNVNAVFVLLDNIGYGLGVFVVVDFLKRNNRRLGNLLFLLGRYRLGVKLWLFPQPRRHAQLSRASCECGGEASALPPWHRGVGA